MPDVTIYEVGPRDGLQNEKGIVPLADKAEFIARLVAAGLPVVEATSFVHPTWVPQLADAADLIELLGPAGRRHPVLVPNERGLDRALELGCVGQLGHPLRVHERGRLDDRQSGGEQPADELGLGLDRDEALLVLESVAGTDLVDRDVSHCSPAGRA